MSAEVAAVSENEPAAAREPSPLERLLQEVAESEHHLRHPEAFAQLCAVAGFSVVKKPHRYEVAPL